MPEPVFIASEVEISQAPLAQTCLALFQMRKTRIGALPEIGMLRAFMALLG